MIKKETRKLFNKINRAWAPPPKLKISEWSNTYRILSPEDSAEPGKYSSDRAPYQVGMMDAVCDAEVEKVVIMASAQIGKTLIELNIIGYYIHQDPSPIMVIVPNKDPIAKDWSRDRLAPMIRDTPELAAKVSDPKARDGENSTLHKKFPGGLIVIVGANSPSDLASRPIRVILGDEVDRFGTTEEGDPIALAEKRSITFHNRKKIYVSTPTIEGASRIKEEYDTGTKEKYHLKCPDCDEYVFLDFYGMVFEHKWINESVVEAFEILYKCPHCFCLNTEFAWKNQPGDWIAESPEIKKTRSFHINAFYSPWFTWKEIIEARLLAKKDPEKLRVVTNTLFGLPYKEVINLDDEDKLLKRREMYPADLPNGVLILTCGVDTQDNRLEYEIVGWGKGKESWGIEYGVILGKPDDPLTWQDLDDVLSKIYYFKNGIGLKISCTCIDSGGHYTTEVYQYTKVNEHRRIVSVKGKGGSGNQLIDKITRNKLNGILVLLGVDEGKTKIISALNVKKPQTESAEFALPRYCHFPENEGKGYDINYFRGLLSEKQVIAKNRGIRTYRWEKISEHIRNEAFDTRNYAQAALELVNPNFEKYEERLKGMPADNNKSSQVQVPKPQKRRGVVKKNNDYY